MTQELNNDNAIEIEEENEGTKIDNFVFDTKVQNFSYEMIMKMVTDKNSKQYIDIPDFQREGGVWDEVQKSNLILSILKGIPVPSLFIFKNSDGKNEIIDGLQRITAMREFFEGKLILHFNYKNTINKVTNKYENKKYEELKSEIDSQSLSLCFIKQDTPGKQDDGKFEIFKILNQNTSPLTKQEIRNCVYRGEFNNFIKTLNDDDKWRKIYTIPKNKSRYYDCELIIRCLIATFYLDNFKDNMSETINLMMQDYNKNYDNYSNQINKMKKNFITSVDIIDQIDLPSIFKANKAKYGIVKLETIISTVMNKVNSSANIDIKSLQENITTMLKNEKIKKITSAGGTGTKTSLTQRLDMCKKILFP